MPPSGIDYKSFELEQAAASAVSRPRSTLGTAAKVVPLLGAIGFAGYLLYTAMPKSPSSMVKKTSEEFHTEQFPAPGFGADRAQLDNGKLFIPPPEPEPVVPPAPQAPPAIVTGPPATDMPPPPPIPPLTAQAPSADDAEAKRLAELERQRLAEEERKKWERLRAPQVVADNANTGALDAAKASEKGAAGTGAEDDPNRRFLASAGSAGVDVSTVNKLDRPDALVTAGTMINAVLITAIQSDLPGQVKAVTSDDVYSLDGRRVLIGKGSQLIGEYKSGLAQGQTRVFIVWTRVIGTGAAGTYSVQLGSIGTDPLGRAGTTGFVDNHYVERFGSAILLSVVGGVAQYITTLGQTSQQATSSSTTTTDPTTGAQTTTTTQPATTGTQARQIGAQQTAQTLTDLANQALKSSISIPPTVYVDQGTRISVFVKRDLDFSYLYADPVKEALRELKRERASKTAAGVP